MRVKRLSTRGALLRALRTCEPCLRDDLLASLPPPSRNEYHASRDVALLAAAAPEPIGDDGEPFDEQEHREDDEPQPIRDVLLALAADWHARAEEARAILADFAPSSAGTKLHHQADLLEQCADTLLAALEGKEEA